MGGNGDPMSRPRVGANVAERNSSSQVAVELAAWELTGLREGDVLDVIDWSKVSGGTDADFAPGVVRAIVPTIFDRRIAWVSLDRTGLTV